MASLAREYVRDNGSHELKWMVDDYFAMDEVVLQNEFENFCGFYKLPFAVNYTYEVGTRLLDVFINEVRMHISYDPDDAESCTGSDEQYNPEPNDERYSPEPCYDEPF
jgi:5-hydroxyisourate hydrolase-like protein (transthyretin family)